MPRRTQQSGNMVSSVPWGSGAIATILSWLWSCVPLSPPWATKLGVGIFFILVTFSPLLGLV